MLQKPPNTRQVRFIKLWRTNEKLSRQDVINKTGVRESNLSLYINGRVPPTRPFLKKFYSVYKIDEDKILISDEDYAYVEGLQKEVVKKGVLGKKHAGTNSGVSADAALNDEKIDVVLEALRTEIQLQYNQFAEKIIGSADKILRNHKGKPVVSGKKDR